MQLQLRAHALLRPLLLTLILLFSAVSLSACCGGGGGGGSSSSDYSASKSKSKKKKKKDKKKKKKDKKKKDKKKKKKDKKKALKPIDGSKFNKFFPDDGTKGTKRVFTQEKTGYAEAKYTKDGKELAKVAITDLGPSPSMVDKFEKSSEDLKGFPYLKRGKNGSMILIKDRVQVKVTSKELSEDDRKSWIKKADLDGLKDLAKKGK